MSHVIFWCGLINYTQQFHLSPLFCSFYYCAISFIWIFCIVIHVPAISFDNSSWILEYCPLQFNPCALSSLYILVNSSSIPPAQISSSNSFLCPSSWAKTPVHTTTTLLRHATNLPPAQYHSSAALQFHPSSWNLFIQIQCCILWVTTLSLHTSPSPRPLFSIITDLPVTTQPCTGKWGKLLTFRSS